MQVMAAVKGCIIMREEIQSLKRELVEKKEAKGSWWPAQQRAELNLSSQKVTLRINLGKS